MASNVLLPQESDYTKGVLLWTARKDVEQLDNRNKHIKQKLVDMPACAATTSGGGGHGTLNMFIHHGQSDFEQADVASHNHGNEVKLRRPCEKKTPI